MTFSVTTLGCSAMYSTAEVAASGYLVDIDGFTLWMDAGGGTWQQLLKTMDFAEVDGIYLSHRHPDHTIDAFQFFHARLYGGRELPPIPLWAPEETVDRITGFSTELSETFDITTIDPEDVIDIGGAKASFVAMAHPPQTCGIRIEADGAVLAYTADTGPAADLATLCGGADVMICEATFQDSDEPWWEGHMSAAQAGRAASDTGVGKLLLTHLPDGRDLGLSMTEARLEAGSVTVELAEPGRTVEVTS